MGQSINRQGEFQLALVAATQPDALCTAIGCVVGACSAISPYHLLPVELTPNSLTLDHANSTPLERLQCWWLCKATSDYEVDGVVGCCLWLDAYGLVHVGCDACVLVLVG